MGIGAIIGGGLGLVGSVLGSSSNRRAATQAAEVSQANTDATVGLQRDIYNTNVGTLNPYVTRGNAAGNAINDILGLGGSTPQPNALSQFYGTPGNAGLPYGIGDNYFGPGSVGLNPAAFGDATGALEGYYAGLPGGAYTAPATSATVAPQMSAQDAQNAAFENFRNSTGFQFRLGEGMNALNSGWAGSGLLQSGAAMQDAIRYGQNFASNEFGNFVGLLSQQQGAGLQAAGAQAGVGVNYGNTVAQLNQTNASNQANAALVRGANNPFASALGTAGGALLGYYG